MNVKKHLIIFALLLAACTSHTTKNDTAGRGGNLSRVNFLP